MDLVDLRIPWIWWISGSRGSGGSQDLVDRAGAARIGLVRHGLSLCVWKVAELAGVS